MPARFDVSKRCAYHQSLGHDTDKCFGLCHAIQDLIDNKVIAPPTKPSITKNPLPNHNFGRGPRINYLMTEEESEEDPSELIYDLPEYFMMTWEELMGMTSIAGYDIWSEDVRETTNYPTFTNGRRHFKPQSSYLTSKNGGRHFKPRVSYQTPAYGGRHFEPQSNNPIPISGGRHFKSQSNDSTSTYGGRHFKPQDIDLNDPTKIAHITRGETLQTHIWRQTTR